MPNLENLRKQAKLYLRWHRDGYHPVAAAIRATLPRYMHLTDRQVLAASFKLSDAQELVARQSGFDSWQALKTGVQAMPTANPTTMLPVLSGAEAQLYVSNVAASCDYYAKLGFVVAFTYGEPAFYGQVARDNARLNSAWSASRSSQAMCASAKCCCRLPSPSTAPRKSASSSTTTCQPASTSSRR